MSVISTTRPTIEDTAWVLRHLAAHLAEGGSFRYLIYDRMGYDETAYSPLYKAGGMEISNAFNTIRDLYDWYSLSDEGLRLRCGEMTAQEIRTVRAILKAIEGGGE